MRGEACSAIISNYNYLLELWDWSLLNANLESDTRAKILGAKSTMQSFNFLFGTHLNKRVLMQTDILAKRLQGYTVSAVQGAAFAKLVREQLAEERNDDEFNNFWEEVLKSQEEFNVSEPMKPRLSNSASAKDHFRAIYFETYDLITATIASRFDQPDFQIYIDLQEIFMKTIKGKPYEDEMQQISKKYPNDVSYNATIYH